MAASYSRSGNSSSLSLSEQCLVATIALIMFGFLAYAIYDAAVASASEVLQRVVVVSPLLLVVAVHWLSLGGDGGRGRGRGYNNQAGGVGFPWGVGFVLIMLLFPWSGVIMLLLLYFFFLTN